MPKTIVVLFHPHKAEVLVNPREEDYISQPSYVVNPDLSQVLDYPPHMWALSGGKVVPVPAKEVERREALILPKASPTPRAVVYIKTPLWYHIIPFALSLLGAYLMQRYLK